MMSLPHPGCSPRQHAIARIVQHKGMPLHAGHMFAECRQVWRALECWRRTFPVRRRRIEASTLRWLYSWTVLPAARPMPTQRPVSYRWRRRHWLFERWTATAARPARVTPSVITGKVRSARSRFTTRRSSPTGPMQRRIPGVGLQASHRTFRVRLRSSGGATTRSSTAGRPGRRHVEDGRQGSRRFFAGTMCAPVPFGAQRLGARQPFRFHGAVPCRQQLPGRPRHRL